MSYEKDPADLKRLEKIVQDATSGTGSNVVDQDLQRKKMEDQVKALRANVDKTLAAREQEIARSIEQKLAVGLTPSQLVDALFEESKRAFLEGKIYQGNLFARAATFIYSQRS